MGTVLPGKVTGIAKFGAFVAIGPGKSGLVHISEIANSYVSDVSAFLAVGQEVQVKIIGIDEAGRINLSIKQAQPAQEKPTQAESPQMSHSTYRAPEPKAPAEQSFEDKLKRFMQDSDSKISGIRQYSEKRSSRRRNKG